MGKDVRNVEAAQHHVEFASLVFVEVVRSVLSGLRRGGGGGEGEGLLVNIT